MIETYWAVGPDRYLQPATMRAIYGDERAAWYAFNVGPVGTVLEKHEDGCVTLLAARDAR